MKRVDVYDDAGIVEARVDLTSTYVGLEIGPKQAHIFVLRAGTELHYVSLEGLCHLDL